MVEEDTKEQDVSDCVGVEGRQKSCLLRLLGCRCEALEAWRRNPSSGKVTVLVHSPLERSWLGQKQSPQPLCSSLRQCC